MPRFTGQNKKRIDPRYFLDETMEIDEAIAPIGGAPIPGYGAPESSKWKPHPASGLIEVSAAVQRIHEELSGQGPGGGGLNQSIYSVLGEGEDVQALLEQAVTALATLREMLENSATLP